ncbi:MAG TPA: hypothetical protein DDX29_12030 [Clostridiales bacterium]|nr:hypothetical protein [Clostridiales bacterium]
MSTLDQIYAKLNARLIQEAGSFDWWTEAEVKQFINDVYRETCRETQIIKKRDTSLVTVAEQVAYDIPTPTGYSDVLSVDQVWYDGDPIGATTTEELDKYYYDWRNDNSGIPIAYYYEKGEELSKISLYQKPSTADKEIALELSLIPSEMTDAVSPLHIFKDGLILFDATMYCCLSKSGGGRDLDRANFYFAQFQAKLDDALGKPLHKKQKHVLRSVDESGVIVGPRLPSNYPSSNW